MLIYCRLDVRLPLHHSDAAARFPCYYHVLYFASSLCTFGRDGGIDFVAGGAGDLILWQEHLAIQVFLSVV